MLQSASNIVATPVEQDLSMYMYALELYSACCDVMPYCSYIYSTCADQLSAWHSV